MSGLTHKFTCKFPSTPQRVFAALTEADELKSWFAEHAAV
jgi:uncharacterized protein YndB with AHSA1/START domain